MKVSFDRTKDGTSDMQGIQMFRPPQHHLLRCRLRVPISLPFTYPGSVLLPPTRRSSYDLSAPAWVAEWDRTGAHARNSPSSPLLPQTEIQHIPGNFPARSKVSFERSSLFLTFVVGVLRTGAGRGIGYSGKFRADQSYFPPRGWTKKGFGK